MNAFWQDNSGTEFCPFKTSDTVHLLSFATIMLNTDLHRANHDTKKGKKSKKMTKEQFINNLRGVDDGQNIDQSYLSNIYDNIAASPIEMIVESSEEPPGSGGGSHALGSAMDHHTSTGGTSVTAADFDALMGTMGAAKDENNFLADIDKGLRDAEDVLRALAPFMHHFKVIGVDANTSMEVVRYMFEVVWLDAYAIAEAGLQSLDQPGNVIFAALDIVGSALTAAVFLDLKMERLAFATLLMNFRNICNRHVEVGSSGVTPDVWLDAIENASAENAMVR